MTNFEKHKDEIISYLVDKIMVNRETGRISECNSKCHKCLFQKIGVFADCKTLTREWIFEEYKEPSIWEIVPIDTKVMLPQDETAQAYYFAGYNKTLKKVGVFAKGCTSWSVSRFKEHNRIKWYDEEKVRLAEAE